MFLSGMVGTASGGSEKKYKITASSSYIVQDSATPGEIVVVGAEIISMTVKTASDLSIPWNNRLSTTRAAGVELYFVMPAEDVTIS